MKKVMKNVIEILDRYYQSFINKKSRANFFLGLADYVELVDKTEETQKIIKALQRKKLTDIKRLKEYEQKVLEETKQAKAELFKRIEKNKISYESLQRDIKEYQDFKEERAFSSRALAEELYSCLEDIIQNLHNNGYKKLVKDFIVERKKPPYTIDIFTFSKSTEQYETEKKIFDEKTKTELWASWNNLRLVYLTAFKGLEEYRKLKKDKRSFYTALNFAGLVREMREIRDGSAMNGLTCAIPKFQPIHFVKKTYIRYASRIHNYLIQELNKEEAKKPVKEEKINAKAQYDNGILYFRGKKIDFRNKPNQKDLLRTLFKEPEKNWSYDEIQEDWDEHTDWNSVDRKEYWKKFYQKFYNAGDDINKAVAMETQTKDFIIKNTKEIRINPKYI